MANRLEQGGLRQKVADAVRDQVRLRTKGIPVWGVDQDGNARPAMHIRLLNGQRVHVPVDLQRADFEDDQRREGETYRQLRNRQ